MENLTNLHQQVEALGCISKALRAKIKSVRTAEDIESLERELDRWQSNRPIPEDRDVAEKQADALWSVWQNLKKALTKA